MAIYTKIFKSDVKSIEKKFNLGKIISFKGIKKGIENTNYLIRTKNNKYILTIFEKRVQKKDLPFFMSLMDKLNNHKIIIDPHTAVGLGALEKINLAGKNIVLSTAHPCKFPEAIKKAINIKSELPDNLNYILNKKENFVVMNNNIEEVKKYILNKLI